MNDDSYNDYTRYNVIVKRKMKFFRTGDANVRKEMLSWDRKSRITAKSEAGRKRNWYFRHRTGPLSRKPGSALA